MPVSREIALNTALLLGGPLGSAVVRVIDQGTSDARFAAIEGRLDAFDRTLGAEPEQARVILLEILTFARDEGALETAELRHAESCLTIMRLLNTSAETATPGKPVNAPFSYAIREHREFVMITGDVPFEAPQHAEQRG